MCLALQMRHNYGPNVIYTSDSQHLERQIVRELGDIGTFGLIFRQDVSRIMNIFSAV